MEEILYDDLLGIKTEGFQKGFSSSNHYHRYEPTPYSALEKLFSEYKLYPTDQVVDFGCGKGRLLFYIHHYFHASVVGVEMNEYLYHEAVKNQMKYLKKYKKHQSRITFQNCIAEEYRIDQLDNKFYFFNPFTIQIFMKMIRKILDSYEENRREIDVVLYYASEDYTYFLDNYTSFEFKKEIVLEGLPDPYERFLVYRLCC